MKRYFRLTLLLFVLVILFGPIAQIIEHRVWRAMLLAIVILFILQIVGPVLPGLRDAPARRARVKAILAAKPDYVAYGSGAPTWIAVPIYLLFVGSALACIIGYAVLDPYPGRSVGSFLGTMMIFTAIPFSTIAATGVWKVIAWHLRSRFPDKMIAFANAEGIGTDEGRVIPYAKLRRIDPCSRSSKYGTRNWIEIESAFGIQKISVGMADDSPDHILKQLRDRALAAGATLAPCYPNGRPITSGFGPPGEYVPGD